MKPACDFDLSKTMRIAQQVTSSTVSNFTGARSPERGRKEAIARARVFAERNWVGWAGGAIVVDLPCDKNDVS